MEEPSSSTSSSSSRKSRRVRFAPGTRSPLPRINWKKIKAEFKQLELDYQSRPQEPRIIVQSINLKLAATGPISGQLSEDGTLYTVRGNIDYVHQVEMNGRIENAPVQSVVNIHVDGQITEFVNGRIENVDLANPIVLRGSIRRIRNVHHVISPPSPETSAEDSSRVSSNSDGSGGSEDPAGVQEEAPSEDSAGTEGLPSSSSSACEKEKKSLNFGKHLSGLANIVIVSVMMIMLLILCSVELSTDDGISCRGKENLKFNMEFWGYQIKLIVSPIQTIDSSNSLGNWSTSGVSPNGSDSVLLGW